MKKFFALLFANILLIHIGSVPKLGRLYAYRSTDSLPDRAMKTNGFAIRYGVLLLHGRVCCKGISLIRYIDIRKIIYEK